MSLSSYVFRDAAGTTQSRAAAVVSSAFVCANTLVDQSGNATPAGDAAARPINVQLADGTNNPAALAAKRSLGDKGLPVSLCVDSPFTAFAQASLEGTVVSIKSSAGVLNKLVLTNGQASLIAFVQVFNIASGSVTLGSSAPAWPFGTAISIASTTLHDGSVGSAAGVDAYACFM